MTTNSIEAANELRVLNIIEVYAYYDTPLLYAAKNVNGRIYLCLNVRDDDYGQEWIYSYMSEDMFQSVHNGHTSFYSAIRGVDEGRVIYRCMNKKEQSFEYRSIRDIPDSMLPYPDEKVSRIFLVDYAEDLGEIKGNIKDNE